MGWIWGERKENRQPQLSESTLMGLSRLFNRQIPTLADGAPQPVTAAVETEDPLGQPRGGNSGTHSHSSLCPSGSPPQSCFWDSHSSRFDDRTHT